MADTTDGFFTVSQVHRDDLRQFLSAAQVARLTDDDLAWIVARMHEYFMASGDYWNRLEQFAREALRAKRAR